MTEKIKKIILDKFMHLCKENKYCMSTCVDTIYINLKNIERKDIKEVLIEYHPEYFL